MTSESLLLRAATTIALEHPLCKESRVVASLLARPRVQTPAPVVNNRAVRVTDWRGVGGPDREGAGERDGGGGKEEIHGKEEPAPPIDRPFLLAAGGGSDTLKGETDTWCYSRRRP
ncbi:hypothetical protein MRX96_054242 [Rhipicephalus microplus]